MKYFTRTYAAHLHFHIAQVRATRSHPFRARRNNNYSRHYLAAISRSRRYTSEINLR